MHFAEGLENTPFSQLLAAKNGSKNGASQKTFGPSYLDRALVLFLNFQICTHLSCR